MTTDRGVLDPETVEQLQSLSEVASGHLTSWPSSRRISTTGRMTNTCGLLVRSIQTRIGAAR